jgi:phosphocarrier protein HPr
MKATRTVEICNERGLHARASAKFVKMSGEFDAEVTVSRDGQTVDARSIMGLMMLAASFGTKVEICAEGPDAAEALKAMLALAEAKFGEE